MRFIIIIVAIITLASCRSTRQIQTAIAKRDTIDTVSVAKIDTAALINNAVQALNNNRIDFKTFSAKIDVDYRGGDDKHYDVNATLRMYKDSLIWVSVNALLGIEAMRMLINKDSVFLLDKLNKTYLTRSIDYLQEISGLPLTLPALQNLLVGNPVFVDSIVSYSNDNNSTALLSVGKSFKNLLSINSSQHVLVNSKLDDLDITRSRTANLSYDDYEHKKGKNFSSKRRISVSEKNKLDISLHFKQYEYNDDVSFPFSIPRNYQEK